MSAHEHHYSNGEITVVWKPEACQHSTVCWKGITGLPQVFQPGKKPWIDVQGAPSERIREQIERFPSGALSWIPASPESHE